MRFELFLCWVDFVEMVFVDKDFDVVSGNWFRKRRYKKREITVSFVYRSDQVIESLFKVIMYIYVQFLFIISLIFALFIYQWNFAKTFKFL